MYTSYMRQYYKHNHGYINIDDENIYFTRTGNWQEAHEAEEKKSKKKIGLIDLVTIIISIAVIVFFIIRKDYVLILLAVLPFGQLLYRYFTQTVYMPYKVPRIKIQALELKENGFVLHFFNTADEPDKQAINGIDEGALDFIKSSCGY